MSVRGARRRCDVNRLPASTDTTYVEEGYVEEGLR